MQKAIHNEDFANAARYMNIYYELNETLPIHTEDKETMKKAENELLKIMEFKLEESIQKHHTDDVLTYSVLYETYGRGSEGFNRFSEYITSEFQSQCKGFIDELRNTARNSPDTKLYWEHLSVILQMCSDNLLQYVSIKDKFKSVTDAYVLLVKKFYEKCYEFIGKILQIYTDSKKLSNILNSLKNNFVEKKCILILYLDLTLYSNDDINNITDEIALMSQHIENYDRYMKAQYEEYCTKPNDKLDTNVPGKEV